MTDTSGAYGELPTPVLADFRAVVVRQWLDVATQVPYWTVRVHEHFAYVFSPPSTSPGWLSDLRFSSYEDAVAFALEVRPHLLAAAAGHAEKCAGARRATDLIYRVSGAQRTDASADCGTSDEGRSQSHTSTHIGTHDDEGRRTFLTPGEVCVECSDPAEGRWVPVSFCDQQASDDASGRTGGAA